MVTIAGAVLCCTHLHVSQVSFEDLYVSGPYVLSARTQRRKSSTEHLFSHRKQQKCECRKQKRWCQSVRRFWTCQQCLKCGTVARLCSVSGAACLSCVCGSSELFTGSAPGLCWPALSPQTPHTPDPLTSLGHHNASGIPRTVIPRTEEETARVTRDPESSNSGLPQRSNQGPPLSHGLASAPPRTIRLEQSLVESIEHSPCPSGVPSQSAYKSWLPVAVNGCAGKIWEVVPGVQASEGREVTASDCCWQTLEVDLDGHAIGNHAEPREEILDVLLRGTEREAAQAHDRALTAARDTQSRGPQEMERKGLKALVRKW